MKTITHSGQGRCGCPGPTEFRVLGEAYVEGHGWRPIYPREEFLCDRELPQYVKDRWCREFPDGKPEDAGSDSKITEWVWYT